MQYQLGPLIFDHTKAAPDCLHHEAHFRWPSKDRLMRRPALQWVGIGEQHITFEGVIHPTFDYAGDGSYVGIRRVDDMRQLGELGLPLNLHDGLGNYYGRWCIRSVSETRKDMFENSAPRQQQFKLEIVRYGDDDLAEASIVYENGVINTPRVDGITNPDVANIA